MGENSPNPIPERATYGFILYLIANFGFVLYLIWAFVPEEWLHHVGITYLPQRYWLLAGPIYVLLCLLAVIFFYVSYNLLITPPLCSINTITDEHARYLAEDESLTLTETHIPPLGDIPISQVNRDLY
ncbi:phosphatidylinositol N-acetylglucosaminyltransferase subunit P-like [Actinia tenebrosa]|uniref:Phosphatidylinositol N-acetylglucosaminyltransferase subunit P n=1 Tax=Actinia tenebrosa TaxID=6105 RepID=A0A6P8ISA9_ACTTE|nr:phosphatidylinositol N-acetylglucosaminyltransferase subunit P-like [Actinia tenebrosa]